MSSSSTLRTETGQQYAIRKALEAEQAKKAKKVAQDLRPPAVVTPGHEVDLETVITRTKKGTPNQSSHLGKLVAVGEESGWELKAGASEYFTGDKVTEEGKFTAGRVERLVWIEARYPGKLRMVCSITQGKTTILLGGRVASIRDAILHLEQVEPVGEPTGLVGSFLGEDRGTEGR